MDRVGADDEEDEDEEEEEEALTQDPFTTSTLGPGRPSACTRASGCAGGR